MSTTLKIDVEKLASYLERNGYNKNDLSEDMGFNRLYLTNVFGSGRPISAAAYNSLCYTIGVSKDMFILKEDPATKNKKDEDQKEESLNLSDLRQIAAELKEIKMVLSELVGLLK